MYTPLKIQHLTTPIVVRRAERISALPAARIFGSNIVAKIHGQRLETQRPWYAVRISALPQAGIFG